MEHQEDTSDGEDDEEETGNPPEAKGIGESETMTLHLHREDMKEEVVIDEHGPLQIGIGYSCSEDRTPYHRI